MHVNRWTVVTIGLLLVTVATAPVASAHGSYETEDGAYSLVIGEQGEPVYTWDWTGLDLIVRETATDGPVEGVHHTLNATYIAPDGTEMTQPLEPQFGEVGRYEFSEGYILTQPGQYQLHLEGRINDTQIDRTFDMPGPRKSMGAVSFPDEQVPSVLTIQQAQDQLKDRVQTLEGDVDALRTRVADLEERVSGIEAQNGMSTSGFGALGAVGAVAVAFLLGRRFGG